MPEYGAGLFQNHDDIEEIDMKKSVIITKSQLFKDDSRKESSLNQFS